MADTIRLLEIVEDLSSQLVLADLSDPAELEAILSKLNTLRAEPDMKALALPSRMIVSTAAGIGVIKKSAPQKAGKIVETLLGALKDTLTLIGQGEKIDERVAAFNADVKALTQGASAAPAAAVQSESQAREMPNFITNAKGLLDETEKALLVLEKNPEDKDRIDEAFRAFHTIKGESNLLSLGGISGLAHEAEDLLGLIRSGEFKATSDLVTALLGGVDALRASVAALTNGNSADAAKAAASAIESLKKCHVKKEAPVVVPVAAPLPAAPSAPALAAEEGKFVPTPPVLDLSSGADIFQEFVAEGNDHLANAEKSVLALETTPGDKEAINNIFRAFHTIKGAAGFLELKDIRMLAHEAETMLDMVRKDVLVFEGRVVELTLNSVDLIRQLLTGLAEQAANGGAITGAYPDVGDTIAALKEVITGKKKEPIGEILLKEGAITETELREALKIQSEMAPEVKVGEILVATNAASAKQVQGALEAQKTGAPVENSIKIQLEKLDMLIDQVGELVISETQVVQNPLTYQIQDQKYHKNIGELDRITRRLQQLVMGMRLVQVGPSFQKMVRLVRDLSKKLGKEVSIALAGEDTEIDKNMVELVGDPLMHMVRNSLDHGIEPKEVRLKAGKPAAGKIQLSAYHKGGYVVIEIKDDGGGLKKERILQKAVERGIVKPGEELSDKRIFNLIFEAGFSTAEKVTDVSGRGVGMDVVKKNIEKLRGKVEIESEEGKGSTFYIYLPITLAIIEGIVVRVGVEKYILPINAVVEFVKGAHKDLSLVYDKGEMYKFYDKLYPLIRLSQQFAIRDACADIEQTTVCLIETDAGRACLVVDELFGQQQVVIKSLGEALKKVQGVSGAAILGDGRVGLIIDVDGLVALAVK